MPKTDENHEHQRLCQAIELTCLQPQAQAADIEQICSQAKALQLFGVCVAPRWLAFAKKQLQHTDVRLITVVGFPLGYDLPLVKAFAAQQAIEEGADEIDMVISLIDVRRKDSQKVLQDITGVINAVKPHLVKVIIETGLLPTPQEKIFAAHLVEESGADFVKTCTGFCQGQATVEDIHLLRENLSATIGIKASAGIRQRAQALALLKAGANRLGCSQINAIFADNTD